MVSFFVDKLDDLPIGFRAEPQILEGVVYDGCRVAVAEGAAGEWLELIERET
jgi:hypothetical protein